MSINVVTVLRRPAARYSSTKAYVNAPFVVVPFVYRMKVDFRGTLQEQLVDTDLCGLAARERHRILCRPVFGGVLLARAYN